MSMNQCEPIQFLLATATSNLLLSCFIGGFILIVQISAASVRGDDTEHDAQNSTIWHNAMICNIGARIERWKPKSGSGQYKGKRDLHGVACHSREDKLQTTSNQHALGQRSHASNGKHQNSPFLTTGFVSGFDGHVNYDERMWTPHTSPIITLQLSNCQVFMV